MSSEQLDVVRLNTFLKNQLHDHENVLKQLQAKVEAMENENLILLHSIKPADWNSALSLESPDLEITVNNRTK